MKLSDRIRALKKDDSIHNVWKNDAFEQAVQPVEKAEAAILAMLKPYDEPGDDFDVGYNCAVRAMLRILGIEPNDQELSGVQPPVALQSAPLDKVYVALSQAE